jgi:hypothetical protein
MKKFLFFWIALSFEAYSQQKVLILPFETGNIHTAYQDPATKVFASFVLENKKYVPVLGQNQQEASAKNCALYTKGSINRLYEAVVVGLIVYKEGTDEIVWSGNYRIKNPDELDRALNELAKAMGQNELRIDYSKQSKENDLIELEKLNEEKFFFGVGVGSVNQLSSFEKNASGFGIRVGSLSSKVAADIRLSFLFGDQIKDATTFGLHLTRFLGKSDFGLGGGLEFGTVAVKESEFSYFLNNKPVYSDVEKRSSGMFGRFTASYKIFKSNSVNGLFETGVLGSGFKVSKEFFLVWHVGLAIQIR